MTIQLYRNQAEPNRVDKTEYLYPILALQGTLRDACSVITPTFIIEYDVEETIPTFNYIWVLEFNRYYFVTDIAYIRNGLMEVSLSVDALMSYKDAILNCSAFVDRNEFEYNRDLLDKRRVVEQGIDIEVTELESNLFEEGWSPTSIQYVLNGYKIDAKVKG